ncbi:acyltransferase family protein [Streptoalloteichus hindustanus]|uniref:Peptidoglycan/LPS O-acetylase OafA/YrhL, contains acyltransferase and SGNH-hydrolase domains n=1 Tax=Streptoalloteichus hindustanus TaxID=2017 RepID=A0A1M4XTD9_STRHI|nr:acyltransferase [Streptoalloteichus hindustanus]SHE96837.1 Peptidoglycan/LPS O-acetylase OafA/YrhL, contains acyltransferase and SGNH-hydrolase domains [Streptoalloteichus hindustanus]
MQTARQVRNLPSLTGLRFAAMLPVFLVHVALEGVFSADSANWGFLNGLGTSGYVAVSSFFVLSGFVITWSFDQRDTLRGFYRRRLARVLPNHVVVFGIALVLMAAFRMAVGLPNALAQLLLVQAWIPDYSYLDFGNSVSWSLSVDVVFYGLFPAIILVARKIRPRHLWYWAGVAVLGVVLVSTVAMFLLPAEPVRPLGEISESQYWLIHFLPVSRLFECLLGVVMARIVQNGQWIGLRPLWAFALLLAAYAITFLVPYPYRLTSVTVAPLGLLIASLAVADVEGRRTLLSYRFLVRLGELSYAFYLLHNLVVRFGHLAFGGEEVDGETVGRTWSTPVALALIVAAFALSLGAAWLLHTFVEKPAVRRWSKAGPRPPAEPAVAPAGATAS